MCYDIGSWLRCVSAIGLILTARGNGTNVIIIHNTADVLAAGALQQGAKQSSKEAAQLSCAKLHTTLSFLVGFCALGAHAAWLVFALLAKVKHLYHAL